MQPCFYTVFKLESDYTITFKSDFVILKGHYIKCSAEIRIAKRKI